MCYIVLHPLTMCAPKPLLFCSLGAVLVIGCAAGDGSEEAVGLSSEYVVGGWEGSWSELYSTVEVRSRRPSYGFCTGTLIAERLVLTAGHCVAKIDKEGVFKITEERLLQVGAGYLNSNQRREGEVVGVERVILHEGYDAKFLKSNRGGDSSGVGRPHDLALLLLDEPITVIEPIRILSDEVVHQAMNRGSVGLVSGYGVFDFENNLSGRLYVAEALIERVAATEILTDGDFGDTCFGDSGGPLYVAHQSQLYVIGVVSRGRADVKVDCGAGGIYTFASAYGAWIYGQAEESLTPEEFDAAGFGEYIEWAERDQSEHLGAKRALNGTSCSAGTRGGSSETWWFALVALVTLKRTGARGRTHR